MAMHEHVNTEQTAMQVHGQTGVQVYGEETVHEDGGQCVATGSAIRSAGMPHTLKMQACCDSSGPCGCSYDQHRDFDAGECSMGCTMGTSLMAWVAHILE